MPELAPPEGLLRVEAVTRPWPVEAIGAEARLRRVAACRPEALLRVGVIVNPWARAVRLAGPELGAAVARQVGAGLLRETRDRGALRAAIGHLVGVEGVNVLATLGGDGTLHTVVNELLAYDRAAAEGREGRAPLPVVFALRGGTPERGEHVDALDVASATSLRLEGSFTLDGEVFPRLDPGVDGTVAVEIAAPLRAIVAVGAEGAD